VRACCGLYYYSVSASLSAKVQLSALTGLHNGRLVMSGEEIQVSNIDYLINNVPEALKADYGPVI
jgi:hypothetical protein